MLQCSLAKHFTLVVSPSQKGNTCTRELLVQPLKMQFGGGGGGGGWGGGECSTMA